jgi:endonuclease I/V8-like Glu-specific endopeptidase
MIPPKSLIEETIARYDEHTLTRQKNVEQIHTGSILSVDTPERVNQRLERIARSEVAQTVLQEAKISTNQLSSAEFERLVQERVLGKNDLMGIFYLEYALSVSRTVGRIILRNANGRVVGYGTGFLVSPHLMMTNNHVLSGIEAATNASIEFNYQEGIRGGMLPSITYNLDPLTFFVTDKHLDYSLVAVKETKGLPLLSELGWNPLIEEQGKVILGEYVNIIQHPGGEPKQLALRENQVIDLLKDFLHYQTDTAPGSSGSPVFNDQWEVVGLHHSGVPKRDPQTSQLLAKDGQVWTSAMGEDSLDWIANEGVRISRIIQHIKNQTNLTPNQRQLRAELFDGKRPNLVVAGETKSTTTTSQTDDVVTTSQANGVATWIIPLQISVGLGQMNMLPSSPSKPIQLPPSSANQINSGEVPSTDTNVDIIAQDPELAAELVHLERLRQGEIPYYDRSQDEKERNEYYAAIFPDIERLSADELYQRLHDLLKATHKNKLSYKPSTHLYPWVDLQPGLSIRSIYSRLEFTPEQIIREDLDIEQMRKARLQEIMSNESLLGMEQMQAEIDLLESNLPFNCEHIVPQSWFGKAQPMKGDLHHLFACETDCNSFRGNLPYTDFPDFEEAVRNNCGKREGKSGVTKFEPGFGKGEAARATLYFLIRYPGHINNINQEYKAESLDILLKWHRQHSATEHEKHRNMAISRKQGNRNPLIDFPEWADKINFRKGLG